MKKIAASFLLFFSIAAIVSMTTLKKTKIVFFGDSITQAGVNPGGYIDLMNKKLIEKKQDANYELIGAGIGGNKIYDLYLRMEDDVMAKEPDVVVIWVGVNDVWHKASYGTGTDPDKFEKFYTAVIKKLQAKNISVVLTTPAAIGEKYDNSNQQDGDLNAYSTIIRDLAKKMNCKLCDLRKLFMDYEVNNNKENKPQGILTSDRVHLNDKGKKYKCGINYTCGNW
jgi:lysophospholipase L1-like esterase